MHVETYPAFLIPRDEEPSHSCSEEKSSEFDLLERKSNEKTKIYIWKAEQVLCKIYSLLLQNVLVLLLRTGSRELYIKKITKQKYLRLFTPFPNLITKESYGWWITRRKWGFRHQKSEAKYPKVSVATFGKLQEKFRRRTKWLWNFAAKGWFRSPAKLAFILKWSASNGCNAFISTPNRAPFEALDC